MRVIVHCDGASRGNPGEAAAGAVLLDERNGIAGRAALRLGVMTNNQAEYHAVWTGMQLAAQLGATVIEFRLDSELAVRQLRREWKTKNGELRALAEKIRSATPPDATVSYELVPRGANALADRLANWALDRTQPEQAPVPPADRADR
jgi:probable phosphoglycerate mutase